MPINHKNATIYHFKWNNQTTEVHNSRSRIRKGSIARWCQEINKDVLRLAQAFRLLALRWLCQKRGIAYRCIDFFGQQHGEHDDVRWYWCTMIHYWTRGTRFSDKPRCFVLKGLCLQVIFKMSFKVLFWLMFSMSLGAEHFFRLVMYQIHPKKFLLMRMPWACIPIIPIIPL